MKKQLLILIALFTVVTGYSQTVGDTFIDNFITYEITSVTSNTVQITNYNTAGGTSVSIPSTIINASIPYSVTKIGFSAFEYKSLTSVTIPNSITEIKNYAFRNNNLTQIAFPENNINIQNFTFTGNPITNVISNNMTPTYLNVGAVFDNVNTIDLLVPIGTVSLYNTNWAGFASVTEAVPLVVGDTFIADFITYEVTSITPATVEIIDYNGGTIVDIPATVNDYVTTYSVTSIGFGPFQGNSITDVTIPNTITSIGGSAFNSNNLTSITIPSSVTNIGNRAFANNPMVSVISEAVVPPTIVTGGTSDSFYLNRSNVNLVVPNGTTAAYDTDSGALWTGFKLVYEVTSIASNTLKVMKYNSNATNVSIPATITDVSEVYEVTEIGISAFFDKGLTSVTIPNSITTIGTSAFNTNNLANVTIPDSVTLIGSQAFVTNDLTALVIGDNVTEIGFGAFADNDLTDITIPSNVTNIGLVAFAANPLTDVTSLATIPPTITTGTNDTFEITGDRSGIHLHIPAGTMGAYVTDVGALWTGFNPVTEDALSISDFELANNIKLITTTDGLKVISPNSIRLENYTIYSISGAKIKAGTESTISIDSMSKGVYVMQLNFDKGRVTKKFIM